jgi:hypothetical protein
VNNIPESEKVAADPPSPLSLRQMNSITLAGLLMIYTSIAAFGTGAYFLYRYNLRDALAEYVPEALAVGVGLFAAALGVKLVRSGGLSPSDPLPVVNPIEWKVLATSISENKDDPVGQYIRLSSLTGATGLFTKLGLSGLPLATIGLTIFFALLSLVPGSTEQFQELTQLTLGAFIGSFVQKQVGALREASGRPDPASAGGPSASSGSGQDGTGTASVQSRSDATRSSD